MGFTKFIIGQKILLIGSASYMPEWWSTHGQVYKDHGYFVAAINNAWAVPTTGLPDMWIHPWDYYKTSPREMHPPAEAAQLMDVVSDKEYKRLKHPFSYRPTGGGTMLLNALVYLLNRLYEVGGGTLSIAGCDLNYGGLRTHFYNGGRADPIRNGISWIVDELAAINEVVEKHEEITVYNAGWLQKTVLPFQRNKVPK